MKIRHLLRAFLIPALVLATGIVAAGTASPAASLTASERAAVAFIDAHQAEALALLARLVNVNSGTHNLAGVREVGNILRTRLDRLGFRTRWIDGAAFGRAGHLVAEHPGTGPRVVLIG